MVIHQYIQVKLVSLSIVCLQIKFKKSILRVLLHWVICQESLEMKFSFSKAPPKGMASLCPVSLSISVSHWHCGRNIYSGPVLLRRAKIDTWHKCLESFRPGPRQQTNLPLRVSKLRSGLLYHYLITHWLWNSDISDMHPCSCPVHAALLMVAAVLPLEIYSCQGGTAVIPWQDMKTSLKLNVIALSGLRVT